MSGIYNLLTIEGLLSSFNCTKQLVVLSADETRDVKILHKHLMLSSV